MSNEDFVGFALLALGMTFLLMGVRQFAILVVEAMNEDLRKK